MKTTKSRWYNIDKCVKCHSPLSSDEKIYSSRRCPKCGYKEPMPGTVVDTYSIGVRSITKSWWNLKFPFYHKEVTYEEFNEK